MLRFNFGESPPPLPDDASDDRTFGRVVSDEAVDAFFRRIDVDAYARRLAHCVPTLQQIAIVFLREQQPNGYWRIDGRDTVERLTEEQGVKMVKESPFAADLTDKFVSRNTFRSTSSYSDEYGPGVG